MQEINQIGELRTCLKFNLHNSGGIVTFKQHGLLHYMETYSQARCGGVFNRRLTESVVLRSACILDFGTCETSKSNPYNLTSHCLWHSQYLLCKCYGYNLNLEENCDAFH